MNKISLLLLKMMETVIIMMMISIQTMEGAVLIGDNLRSQERRIPEIQLLDYEGLLEDDIQEDYDIEVPPPPEYTEKEDQEEVPFNGSGRSTSRKGKIHPWPNAQIPYAIWGSNKTKKKVLAVLAEVEAKTCLRFVPRESELSYVVIKEDDGGCWSSSIGYPSSDKKVIVGLGKGCLGPGRILHEVLHAAGFLHEHVRPDRGNYISINWDNINKKGRPNYKLDYRYQTLAVPYDYKSVMHYGQYSFAMSKSHPTMVPKTAVVGNLGGSSLTSLDVQRINTFYQCKLA